MSTNTPEDTDLDLVWGAAAIGRELNLRNERQAFYLLESGTLPAQKVGRQWVTSRIALRRHFADVLSGEGGCRATPNGGVHDRAA